MAEDEEATSLSRVHLLNLVKSIRIVTCPYSNCNLPLGLHEMCLFCSRTLILTVCIQSIDNLFHIDGPLGASGADSEREV